MYNKFYARDYREFKRQEIEMKPVEEREEEYKNKKNKKAQYMREYRGKKRLQLKEKKAVENQSALQNVLNKAKEACSTNNEVRIYLDDVKINLSSQFQMDSSNNSSDSDTLSNNDENNTLDNNDDIDETSVENDIQVEDVNDDDGDEEVCINCRQYMLY
jgi:hypothetical protein